MTTRPFVLAAAPEAAMQARESHVCDRNNLRSQPNSVTTLQLITFTSPTKMTFEGDTA
jgi:hypothetical protein